MANSDAQKRIMALVQGQARRGDIAPPNTLRVDMHGVREVSAALEVWRRLNANAYAAAIYMWATNVLSTSLKLAPADTGYLRASRYLRRPTVDAGSGRFTIEAGYGAPYALFVHEVNQNYVVGEWKFLTKAVNFHLGTAVQEIGSWTARLAQAGKGIDDVPETHPRVWTGGLRREPKRNAARTRQRAKDRARNQERIARELLDLFDAGASGRRPRRPGRG